MGHVDRRWIFYVLGVLGTLVLILSFFALAGIAGWDRDAMSPLRIQGRGIDFVVQHAWHYLVPTAVLLIASLTAALVGGVWLVRNPAPRGAPF